MARPTKQRRVCHFPENIVFLPQGAEAGAPVILTVDEYEVIRLKAEIFDYVTARIIPVPLRIVPKDRYINNLKRKKESVL